MAPPALPLPRPAAMLKASASSGVAAAGAKVLTFPDQGPEPHVPAPASNVVRFPKRVRAVYVRMPEDLYEFVERESDRFFMSKPTWIVRVIQERKDRKAITDSTDIKASEMTA